MGTDIKADFVSGGRTYSVVLSGAAAQIHANRPFAAYMIFGHGSFSVAKPTTLAAINPDITRGRLRADYSACLSADESAGQTISYFALSPDGVNTVCRCDIPPTEKVAGKSFSVLATVYADVSDGSDKTLCGGDNPLARLLLGASALPETAEFVEGDCDRPTCYSLHALPQNLKEATVSFADDGITVSVEADAAAKDVTVLFGGSPALRAVLRGATEAYTVTNAAVAADKCAVLPMPDIESVFMCYSKSGNHAECRLVRRTERVTEVFDCLGFAIGRGAEIKSDPLGEYAAIGGEREIMLVRQRGGRLECAYSVPRGGGDFDVCIGGFLAVILDGVTIYDISGSATKYDVPCGEQNVIVRDGSVFHFAYSDGSAVKRFALSGGVATELPEIPVDDDAILFRCMLRIGIASKKKSYVIDRYAGVDRDVDSYENELLKFYSAMALIKENIKFGGSLAWVRVSYENAWIANLYENKQIVVSAGDDARLFGDYAVLASGEAREYDRATGTARKVEGLPPIENVASIGRIGDFLLFLGGDGEVRTFYCNRSGGYVYCPTASVGELLTVGLRIRPDPFAGKSKISAAFRISAK